MERRLLVGFSLVVVVAAVAVGPLGVAGESTRSTTDDASVTVESIPDGSLTLERGRFGSGRYHIDAPPAVVSVSGVTGTPVLRYTIDVPGVWLTATSRYEIAGREGRLQLRPSPVTVSPDRVDRRQYDAIVAVWVQSGERDRAVLQRRVTLEVVS
ncbi:MULTISPECIES: hypothetical protein [Haloarcula]|uniref:Uncharacterized protein n=1 Tax=Haloarcula pellucida TaxID=1427151 RepID=A0A830GPQ1_9EURY|nr:MULTISPECIES: hypothetical protein [Halomicroarcula]MBX0349142.1 hypothetical protein [Halomicroarcula pellucida]MDS0279265.1 hypothetical protein [Halomicroarcula sp. S1AR25-4]GGN99224.1 hypothetical protein GCM10009030_30490 [Halomicroarcula pellucida]